MIGTQNSSPHGAEDVYRGVLHHEVSVLQNLSRRALSVVWEHESRCLEFCWLLVPSPSGPADLLLQVACCGVPAARILRL
jgi:hypothetical protein